MARFMIKASEYKNVCKAVNDRKLAELKKEIIEILKKQDEKDFKKATDYLNSQEEHFTHLEKSLVSGKWIEKAGYGVGTVRIWKGKKYKKIAPGKWVRVFDKEGRGTNIAIGKLIAKVNKIDNVDDLMAFVMANKQRFVDENGMDLPVLDKLRAAVGVKNENLSGESSSYTYGVGENVSREKNKIFEGKEKITKEEADLHKVSRKFEQIPTTELKQRKAKLERWIENKTRNKRDSLNNAIFRESYQKELDAINEVLDKRNTKKEDKPAEKKTVQGVKILSKNEIHNLTKGEVQDYRKELHDAMKKLDYGDSDFDILHETKKIADDTWNNKEYKGAVDSDKNIKDFENFLKENNLHQHDKIEYKGKEYVIDYDSQDGDGDLLWIPPVFDDPEFDVKEITIKTKDKEDVDPRTGKENYWIVDSRGNRLTNKDAIKRIQDNLARIDELENSDEPRKDMKIKDLKFDNEYLRDRLNPDDRKESEAEKHQNRSDAMKMPKDELKKYVMDKANEYYKNNQDALTKKANEAVEKMTAAECNKETQLTDKNSLGMFVDKFDADGKTPTDKELQELAYNVVLSRVAAAKWGDKNRKELAEQNEAETKQKEEAIIQKENEIKEKYHGYFENRKGLDKARDLKTLEKKYNFDGKVMSSKEFVEQAIDNGVEIKEREVNKLDYPSRTRWNRMNGYEQDEYEKRIKEAGKKTVYSINGFEFPKTVVDYAKFYKENGKSKSGSEKPSKSEIAIKNKATSLAGAFGYSKTYATKMGSPFNLELAEQTVDEELDWDDGSKKALKEELRRIYSEKKVQKSLFDDFVMDMFIDEDEEIEDAIKADESLFNDYSAEEPDEFNSIKLQVCEAMNRHYGNCL